jgi:LPS-assembly lipoprotein
MRNFLFIILLFLGGCGFTPLYQDSGPDAPIGEFFADIDVAPIADRLGQQMRNELLTNFKGASASRYELRVVLGQDSLGYGTRPDAAATQEQLTLNANVVLYDRTTDQIVYDNAFTARTSFDLVLSDFSNVVQREDSARRLALQISERIYRRVAVYFRGLDKSEAAGS